MNFRSINNLHNFNLVDGLPEIEHAMDDACSTSQLDKQVRLKFKNKGSKLTSRCLELLHMDSFEPILVNILRRIKYTLIIIDDFSRFT